MFLLQLPAAPERCTPHLRFTKFKPPVGANRDMVVFTGDRVLDWTDVSFEHVLDEKPSPPSFKIQFKLDICKDRIRLVAYG